ncbi:response regulator transcription factor [Anoxynatronum sibiricum]|uniref:Stage 0 sporulation protein A homolog n=1 Tax=Anoxynatronum sibiricum TaxID=210623 RepID=A0ABU9VU52_9CLOT
MIKVLLADDQILFLTMLEEIVKADQRFEMVGCVQNGHEAVEMADVHEPDVVLLDIRMPEMDGLSALKKIKEAHPLMKVMMLTTFEDPFSINDAFLAGADGYLLKNMKPAALLSSIFCVAHDMLVVHREIYETGLKRDSQLCSDAKMQMEVEGVQFSKTDLQIVKCIAEGKTNKEIAKALSYSEGTIKNRVSQLLSKTGLSDRTQISIYALKNNLI